VDALLEHEPHCEHLAITCNRQGQLATNYRGQAKFHLLVLDERTADRSLMMTSSFTNMVLAGAFLGRVRGGAGYRATVEALARMGKSHLLEHTGTLALVARLPFRSAVFLGDGCRHGAARERALKILESTAERIPAFAETFLGLRHGPMRALHADTLVVAYLSSAPVARAYQLDLIEELRRKGLGLVRLITGEDLELGPHADEIHLNRRGTAEVDDSSAVVLDVMTGQLLALFRSLHEGLKPDWPSQDGRISRVVGGFRIHSHRLGVTA
jgi:tagatose-6-phosphate ketose/aldose isomerase